MDEPTPVLGLVPISKVEQLLAQVEEPAQIVEALEQARAIAREPAVAKRIAELQGVEDVEAVRRHGMESWLWASRRLGELLPEKGQVGAGRGNKNVRPADISRQRAVEFRKLAALPLDAFRAQLEAWRDAGTWPSKSKLLKLAEPAPRPPAGDAGGGDDTVQLAVRVPKAWVEALGEAKVPALPIAGLGCNPATNAERLRSVLGLWLFERGLAGLWDAQAAELLEGPGDVAREGDMRPTLSWRSSREKLWLIAELLLREARFELMAAERRIDRAGRGSEDYADAQQVASLADEALAFADRFVGMAQAAVLLERGIDFEDGDYDPAQPGSGRPRPVEGAR